MGAEIAPLEVTTLFSNSPVAQVWSLYPLFTELPALIQSFAESEMIRDRCLYGLGFLPSLRLFFGLNRAVKLGRQDTMTATADSRFVQSAVEPLTPPLVFVSTARKMSNPIVMNAQQKIPARPIFTGVRIWRPLSIARGNAMTNIELASVGEAMALIPTSKI